jgi:hypothetical protein
VTAQLERADSDARRVHAARALARLAREPGLGPHLVSAGGLRVALACLAVEGTDPAALAELGALVALLLALHAADRAAQEQVASSGCLLVLVQVCSVGSHRLTWPRKHALPASRPAVLQTLAQLALVGGKPVRQALFALPGLIVRPPAPAETNVRALPQDALAEDTDALPLLAQLAAVDEHRERLLSQVSACRAALLPAEDPAAGRPHLAPAVELLAHLATVDRLDADLLAAVRGVACDDACATGTRIRALDVLWSAAHFGDSAVRERELCRRPLTRWAVRGRIAGSLPSRRTPTSG